MTRSNTEHCTLAAGIFHSVFYASLSCTNLWRLLSQEKQRVRMVVSWQKLWRGHSFNEATHTLRRRYSPSIAIAMTSHFKFSMEIWTFCRKRNWSEFSKMALKKERERDKDRQTEREMRNVGTRDTETERCRKGRREWESDRIIRKKAFHFSFTVFIPSPGTLVAWTSLKCSCLEWVKLWAVIKMVIPKASKLISAWMEADCST